MFLECWGYIGILVINGLDFGGIEFSFVLILEGLVEVVVILFIGVLGGELILLERKFNEG